MPGFFRAWLYYLNPITWLIAGLVTNELHDLEITCLDSEYRTIEPPGSQTCEQWMGAYVSAAGGYLRNPNDSAACQYCQYSVGDQFTNGLDITYSDRGLYLVYFLVYSIVRPALLLALAGRRRRRSALTPRAFLPRSSTACSPSSARASSPAATRSARQVSSSRLVVVVDRVVAAFAPRLLVVDFSLSLSLLAFAYTFPSFLLQRAFSSYSRYSPLPSVPFSRSDRATSSDASFSHVSSPGWSHFARVDSPQAHVHSGLLVPAARSTL